MFNPYWGSFQGVNWMVREVNRSYVPNTKFRNEWSHISTPPICLCLYVVNNGRFILILTFLLVIILGFLSDTLPVALSPWGRLSL